KNTVTSEEKIRRVIEIRLKKNVKILSMLYKKRKLKIARFIKEI
ncbi:9182_t:CDS:1, partial [Cetraspora pellucida]